MAESRDGVHPMLLRGRRNNPGMKLRLTQRALDYANEVIMKGIERQVPKTRIAQVSRTTPDGKGHVTLTNIRFNHFKSPSTSEFSMVPPNLGQWTMRNTEIG